MKSKKKSLKKARLPTRTKKVNRTHQPTLKATTPITPTLSASSTPTTLSTPSPVPAPKVTAVPPPAQALPTESPLPAASELDRKNKRLFVLGSLALLLIVLATVSVLFVYWRKPPETEKKITPVAVISSPGPTTQATFNREEWLFEVLNGSGIAGAAAEAAVKLTTLGYKVIKIGNASEQTYTTSQLFVAPNLVDQSHLILDDLEIEFGIASFSGQLTDSTASARLIVGKNGASADL